MTLKSCERCGKTIKSYCYETMCYKCSKEKNLEGIKESILSGEKLSTYGEDEVICPWCGEVLEVDCETDELYVDGQHVMRCYDCNKEFTLSTSVSYSYSTERDLPSWILRDREIRKELVDEQNNR